MDLPGFSEMEAEKACDYNDHYDYAGVGTLPSPAREED
jgi:hypothetical protein